MTQTRLPEARITIAAPQPPLIPPKHRMPVLATIAPIIASGALFAITRSSFALIFAALGPIIAVASAADSLLQRRRAARQEGARFERDSLATVGRLVAAHDAERTALEVTLPPIDGLESQLERSSTRWRGAIGVGISVRLGTATLQSAVRYSGADVAESPVPGVAERLDELRAAASGLLGAPFALDVTHGIGFAGPAALALSAARATILQLAHALSPDTSVLEVPATEEWSWSLALPHSTTAPDRAGGALFRDGEQSLLVAVAPSAAELPRDIGLVVTIAADASASADSRSAPGRFDPDFVGVETATSFARALRELADREGVRAALAVPLPEKLELASLAAPASGRLSAALGVGDSGTVALDLASDGPHAIVGGTTGSGKSELLLSWVLGMAVERAPTEVSFLFVDFKGGAAFDALSRLPHCVGVITDLDVAQSLRAISSLSAELRRRERGLAAAGARSIDDVGAHPPFPRLVVVVDEYAALLETHEGLHSVFADIAARGRSLGVHLILCTQRPAGVVRDSILANCALRLSLRVHSPADSVAVVGTDAASRLPARPPGRALASLAGAPPFAFQVALARQSDIDRVAAKWADSPRALPPWRPPLPERVRLDVTRLTAATIDFPFALVDLPEQQRRAVARYRPREHGSLFIVGGGGSGKSGVLAALAVAPSSLLVERVAGDLPRLWDALAAAPADRVLLIDDLDAAVSSCPDEYQGPLLDLLTGLLREGPARGTYCAITTQRVTGTLHGIAALCGSVLMLRMPNRQEHVLAGGDPAEFLRPGRPGAAHWLGDRVQIFETEAGTREPPPLATTVVEPTTGRLVVVSTRPEACASSIRALAPGRRVTILEAGFGAQPPVPQVSVGELPDIFVADPDTWQSQWSLLGSLRRNSVLLFDGCSVAEFRAATRSRSLPPPFARGERTAWLLDTEGSVTRAGWPNSDQH